ncbi:hypothetical protein AVEN_57295-1 [Araneus ventricosus]|uniref:Uncharacterized protein n=1 Tax=Araneus ventricosus TaxID=182803 RepID=A0A4Y2IRR9_ARAVE|nr:hypothetical protein AVEN_57295-1 [Araneus ventricosus]
MASVRTNIVFRSFSVVRRMASVRTDIVSRSSSVVRRMASVRTDIVSRSSSVDVREKDKQAKNPWRWERLEKQAEGIYLRDIIRKLNKCGVCYCIVCSKELAYESRGFVARTHHIKSAKHKSFLQTHKEHYALPGELWFKPFIRFPNFCYL